MEYADNWELCTEFGGWRFAKEVKNVRGNVGTNRMVKDVNTNGQNDQKLCHLLEQRTAGKLWYHHL